MISAITFLGSLWGRVAMAGAMLALLVGLRAWDVHHQRQIGAHKEAVRVETVGKAIDAKVQKKRAAVERAAPSEVDSALRKYCRDCK